MAGLFEAITRIPRHLGAPALLLFVAFFWAWAMTNGVVAAVIVPAEPARPWRSRIGRVLYPLFWGGFWITQAAQTSHADLALLWRPLAGAAAAGSALGLAGPYIARHLRLPQLARALAIPLENAFSALARLFSFILAPVALAIGALLQRLPSVSAFRVAMIAVLSACAGLVGMVAYSLTHG